jgi:hypothetical protein
MTCEPEIKIHTPPRAAMQNSQDINSLLLLATSLKKENSYNKILAFSERFIGKPYNFSLGEYLISWDQNKKSQELIDLSSFDCMSYIEIVLALVNMTDIPQNDEGFLEALSMQLKPIMFNSPEANFINRNHFFDSEWLKCNSHIIIGNAFSHLAYAQEKLVTLNKGGLLEKQIGNYAEKYIEPKKQAEFKNKYLTKLQQLKPEKSAISYIKFADFLKYEAQLNEKLQGKIYIFAMVMDNPKLIEITNSDHNIAHVGLVFSKGNKLYLRHATSIGPKTVVEVTLQEYALEKEKSNIFIGFTLFEINPRIT